MTGEMSYDSIATALQRSRDEIRTAFASENIHIYELTTYWIQKTERFRIPSDQFIWFIAKIQSQL